MNQLTRREYFAAIALQGLLANGTHELSANESDTGCSSPETFAELSVAMADALIEQLDSTTDPDELLHAS